MVWKHDSPDYPPAPQPYRPVRETETKWKYCPSCHQTLRPDYGFCPECGRAVGTTRFRNEDQFFCPKCKRRLDQKFKFCPHCGGEPDRSILSLPVCSCHALFVENGIYCPACGKQNPSS
ncbi:TPA: hypothetical protein DDZ01_00195 [Candidatus Uhrbacteria bacterium]|nr:MAG: hypothetical protein UT94_C0034G0015 [Candidatus Uhrbacteria bacterium GW2011_GWF2_40_263]HBK34411.1 hypothetical protein [Candidatus Uhrbacteria bacterium]HCB55777.1 hypothetical protein [Candidatus Uhrbacteria bacterium]